MVKITWQQNSNSPNNAENLETIRQWWSNLNGKEVDWRQRLIPDDGDVTQINWESQKFDEKFPLRMPQVGGITLYWYKLDSDQERNLVPHQLELDTDKQQLFIYPQSQRQVVIRVALPQLKYDMVQLKDPQIAGASVGENFVLLLRDSQQQLEVKITLNPESIAKLKEKLPQ